MHDESFDQIIRNRLNEFEVDFHEEDWNIMESVLDSSGPEQIETINSASPNSGDQESFVSGEDSFDRIISEKLQNFTVKGDLQGDWYHISSQLYGPFDASVGMALENYEVPYDPADWQAMLDYMNAPFYQQVRKKLVNHTVSKTTSDWKNFKGKLDQDPVLSASDTVGAWYPYAIAASLALLLMLWLPQSTLFTPPLLDSDRTITQVEAGPEVPEQQETSGRDSSNEALSLEDNSIESENLYTDSSKEKHTIRNDQITIASDGGSSKTIIKGQSDLATISPIQTEEIIYDDINPLDTVVPKVLDQQELLTEEMQISQEKSERIVQVLEQSEPLANEDLSYWAEKQKNELPLILPVSNRPSNAFQETSINPYEAVGLTQNRRIDPEFWIGFYSGSASSMAELNDPAEFGFVSGMRVELKFNNTVSIVSGINYAQKSYTNQFNTTQTADNAAGFTRVQQVLEAQFSMIEIPALVRLKVPSEEKHSFYIQAGIVPFIMLQEDYNNYNPNTPSNIDRNFTSVNQLEFDPKEQYDATSHNLSFQTYVANLHTALGWEYELNPNLMLQVEPFFQLGLQGIGPPGSYVAERKKLYTGGVAASFIFNSSSQKKKKINP